MNHHFDDEILAAYCRDLLPDDERLRVSMHLEQCDHCQARLTLVEEEAVVWQRLLVAELQQLRPSPKATFSTLNLQKKWSIPMHKVADYLAPVAILLLIMVGVYTFWPATINSAGTAVNPEPTVAPIVENSVERAIQNLTYTPFGGGETITLVNGQAGDVALESYTFGDLNGDGLNDAAFIVTRTVEGSRLPEVGVALNAGDDTLTHVGNEFLFPDADVTLSIVGLQVIVTPKTADSPFPSLTYIVADGRLVQPEMVVAETDEDAQYQQYLLSEWEVGQSPPADSILTRDTLSNMVYQVEYTQNGRANLGVGIYREPPRTSVRLLPNHAYGDLTGDGIAEAVVVLGSNTGGSGSFIDLVVVTVVDGQPQQLATTYLGDGVQIDKLVVEEGAIQLEYDGKVDSLALVAGELQSIASE